MIGLGVVTVPSRRDYMVHVRAGIEAHLVEDGVDLVLVHTDTDGQGVAVAKNALLHQMLEAGCDWLFLSEDDVVVKDRRAVTGYIDACEHSGYGHLMFHAHGSQNPAPLRANGPVTEWPSYVGAWCIYSRESLLVCGLFDEGFRNAWEHVEHSLRLAAAGFTAPWRGAADATGSEEWLEEIPGSIEQSVIRRSGRWGANVAAGCDHWRQAHPDTYRLVFG